MKQILIISLNRATADCCICGEEVYMEYGIPMYEGIPVPLDWEGEWGGFAACKLCYDKYMNGEMEMWKKGEICGGSHETNIG
ncbi:MAG: hypothetical protein HQK55_07950 [Deltaproteobacteria bacterium]|nr:hypothetical protein [Deltaproteobacteria bacterium]